MRKNIFSLFLLGLFVMMMITVMPVYADGEDAPIHIYSNSDFVLYSQFTGSGTVEDPYILDTEYIDTDAIAGIYIMNTDAYVLINNIHISGDGYYGIYLSNVDNLNITNGDIIGKAAAISILNCNRVLIDNIAIDNKVVDDYGINIDKSDTIGIWNCHFNDAKYGLLIKDNYRISILNNVFTDSGISLYMTTQISTGIAMSGNLINGRPIGYLYGMHDASYDVAAYGQGILVNCVNVTVYNADISHTTAGIQFIACQSCVIEDSLIHNNQIGILLYESSYCRISRNNITANANGVLGYFATGTIINENNILSNTHIGLWAYYGCSSSVIYDNNFHLDGTPGNYINAQDDGGIEDSQLIWVNIKFINPISGWPLNNVSVTIEQYDRTYTGYSNDMGLFKVPLPNLGPYNVTIEKFRYQTMNILNYGDVQVGTNIYDIGLMKDNLGPGNGYVELRFLDGVTPVEGATVKVYSYLDGAYYLHSQYTTITGGVYAGGVNITGLYYDNYTVLVQHSGYEDKVVQQIVLPVSLGGSYPYIGRFDISMTPNPTDAFIYGHIYDITNSSMIANVNITIINEVGQHASFFTDIDGFYNITNIPFGTYSAEISKDGYQTEYINFVIDSGGNQTFNPFNIGLVPNDYVPENPMGAVVNNWDNQIVGNYWGNLGGIIVLSSDGPYYIPGTNLGNPMDEHPLVAPYIRGVNMITTIDMDSSYLFWLFEFTIIIGIIALIGIYTLYYRKR
jgi:parallel beta-helix repeat protein